MRAIRFAAWMAAAVGVVPLVQVLAGGFALLRLPYESTRPEAYVLDGVLRVVEGRVPYGRLGELPFVLHVYDPLTYLVPGLAARIAGLDVEGTLVLGRALSFASSLLLGAVLFGIVYRETRRVGAALLAAALPFIFFRILLTDFFRLRPESPGLLLTFAGAALVLTGRRLPWAGVCFVLAFAWKQSFVCAPVAATLALLLEGRRRDAAILAGTMAALLASGGAALLAWAGEAWWDSAVVALGSNPVHPLLALREQSGPLARSVGGLFIAAPFAWLVLRVRGRHVFLGTYVVLCALWTIWSAGKVGAWLNYWSELGVLLALVGALGAAGGAPRPRAFSTVALTALAANVALVTLRGDIPHVWQEVVDPPRGDFAEYVARFSAHEGPRLITEERVAVHVRDPEVLDWVLYDELVKAGREDPALLLARVRSGAYRLIALDRQATTAVARDVYRAVEAGPYRRIWRDEPWNRMDVYEREE